MSEKKSEFIGPFCKAVLSVQVKVAGSPEEAIPKATAYTVEAALPRDLAKMLIIEENQDYVVLKPRSFLGKENFSKIASIIRGLGGEYVSNPENRHFRVKR